MAAGAVGQFLVPGGDARSSEWLTRSVQHMELVGAAQDARSIRVRLDAQLALAGDAEAERRLGRRPRWARPNRWTPRKRCSAWPASPGSASATTRCSPTPTR
ncbi:hypothetical protein NKG94_14565 [Micromonospora sp. M12]